MSEDRRRGEDRRKIHEDCVMHFGIASKLNWNIGLGALAVTLLGTLFLLMTDINATLKANNGMMVAQAVQIKEIDSRVSDLEQESARYHNPMYHGGYKSEGLGAPTP